MHYIHLSIFNISKRVILSHFNTVSYLPLSILIRVYFPIVITTMLILEPCVLPSHANNKHGKVDGNILHYLNPPLSYVLARIQVGNL